MEKIAQIFLLATSSSVAREKRQTETWSGEQVSVGNMLGWLDGDLNGI